MADLDPWNGDEMTETIRALAEAVKAFRAGDRRAAERVVRLARVAAGRPTLAAIRLDLDDLDYYRYRSEYAVNGMVLLMRMLADATAVVTGPCPVACGTGQTAGAATTYRRF